ncbi:m-phase inducer phosphatase [Dimargaris verticillata]|uniref:M-phase inducer phosphatase n=1 Tax=Dimargaris verticillata TaxID=2761393 RepID=A0A9W8EB67_9FUNG|nr:m-phase inducer phosphatase [Dimargaris verticillata]
MDSVYSSPCGTGSPSQFMVGSGLSPLAGIPGSQRSLAFPSPVTNLTANLNTKLFLNRSPHSTPRKSLLDCLTNVNAGMGSPSEGLYLKRQRLCSTTPIGSADQTPVSKLCRGVPSPLSVSPLDSVGTPHNRSLVSPTALGSTSSLVSVPAPAIITSDKSHPARNLHACKPPAGRPLARCRSTMRGLPEGLSLPQSSMRRSFTMYNLAGSAEAITAPSRAGSCDNLIKRPTHRSQSYSEPLEDPTEVVPPSPVSPCYPAGTRLKRTRSLSHAPQELSPQTPVTAGSLVDMITPSPTASSPGTPLDATCQILPAVSCSRDPLKRISMDTMAKVMHGEYRHMYDDLLIVDCRFPYEYEGGHIQGAINVTEADDLDKHFFADQKSAAAASGPTRCRRLVIFHCEYSLHRAPHMAMTFRNKDRQLNAHNYPYLHYPEVYILQGGYRNFFHGHKTLCYPQNYVEMNDTQHRDDCRQRMASFKRGFKRSKSYTEGFPAMGMAKATAAATAAYNSSADTDATSNVAAPSTDGNPIRRTGSSWL